MKWYKSKMGWSVLGLLALTYVTMNLSCGAETPLYEGGCHSVFAQPWASLLVLFFINATPEPTNLGQTVMYMVAALSVGYGGLLINACLIYFISFGLEKFIRRKKQPPQSLPQK